MTKRKREVCSRLDDETVMMLSRKKMRLRLNFCFAKKEMHTLSGANARDCMFCGQGDAKTHESSGSKRDWWM